MATFCPDTVYIYCSVPLWKNSENQSALDKVTDKRILRPLKDLQWPMVIFCVNIHNKQQQQQQQQPFYGPLSGTTRVSRYQKKHSPTHHPDHHPIFISFFHLPRSIASSLFKLQTWQSFCTTSFQILFGLPLGLEPFTSYSIHFFIQSVSSFCSTCPYHHNLFAVVSILYHLFLVFLSTPYLELCLLP